MDRDEILAALADVGQHLHDRGLQGEVYVVGGAAFALAYHLRRTTRDVDAVFAPKMAIYEAAAAVAAERGLPPDWLNDAVKGHLLDQDPDAAEVAELPGLRVLVASPRMLLALKVIAHRLGEDAEDVRRLADMLDLSSAGDVLDVVVDIAGEERLTAQSRFFVEAIMDRSI